jgi:prolyl-tRNA editing enzyme YbaK/EbsC (Cys-tRNA(Pro) deacylase)
MTGAIAAIAGPLKFNRILVSSGHRCLLLSLKGNRVRRMTRSLILLPD